MQKEVNVQTIPMSKKVSKYLIKLASSSNCRSSASWVASISAIAAKKNKDYVKKNKYAWIISE